MQLNVLSVSFVSRISVNQLGEGSLRNPATKWIQATLKLMDSVLLDNNF